MQHARRNLHVLGIAASAAAIDDVISSSVGDTAGGEPQRALKVFIFGFSMGGHMALQMAGKKAFASDTE
jgi:dienelactone hydrolase